MKLVTEMEYAEGMHNRLGRNTEAIILGSELLQDSGGSLEWLKKNAGRLNLPEDTVYIDKGDQYDNTIHGFWLFVSHPSFHERIPGNPVYIRHVEPETLRYTKGWANETCFECAVMKKEVQKLRGLIGEPPPGSHPDEWLPRDSTWHKERQNWREEVQKLKDYISSFRVKV